MTDDGVEIASTGVTLCPRCGLSVGHQASFTYWLFQENRCQCDAKGMPQLQGETAPEPASSRISSSKQILNNRYELLECVGQGGVGYVYRARDQTNGQIVALKIMRPELAQNAMAVKRVMQEVAVVSGLSHSNLGQVHGYGQEKDGAPYLVMEFVEGKNLEELLKAESKFDFGRALELFMQICAGLDCAHANAIIHRDLKPSNVIVRTSKNGQERATIVDFGFARLMRDTDASVRLTQQGEVFGSPAYMSPEQCLGENLDVRSDIYSLGCLMYEVLTGAPPLVAENVLATVAKQVRETPQSMRARDTKIPESIDAIVLKCLKKEPVLRYQSVSDLRSDLDKVKKGEYVTPTRRISDPAKMQKHSPSTDSKTLRVTENVPGKFTTSVWMIVITAVIVGLTAGGSVWMLMQKRSEGESKAPTQNSDAVKAPATGSAAVQQAVKDSSEPGSKKTQKQEQRQFPKSTQKSIGASQVSEETLKPRNQPPGHIRTTSAQNAVRAAQNAVTHSTQTVKHNSPSQQTAAQIGHTASHSSQPRRSAASANWDQLKGLRIYK